MTLKQPLSRHTAWLAVLMALVGATAVMAQSLYVREILVAFFGNELSLGVVLGSWLIGVVGGAWLGGRAARRAARPALWLAAAAVVGAVTLPGGLVAARALRLIAPDQPGGFLPFRWLAVGSALVTIPFSVLVGFTFPVASRAVGHRDGAPASGISLIYVAEALGAVGGGLTFSFVLIGRVGAFHIAMSMTALVVCVATAPAVRSAWRAGRVGLLLLRTIPGAGAIALAVFAATPLDTATTRLRWSGIAPDQTLVATTNSPYGNITLGRWEEQYNLYLDGHFAGSFPEARAFSHAAHLVLCQHPDPKRVLVIGGGMEGLLAPMLRHLAYHNRSAGGDPPALHYVQLDPALPHLLYRFIGEANQRALADPAVTAFETDGRSFIRAVGSPDRSQRRLERAAVRCGQRLQDASPPPDSPLSEDDVRWREHVGTTVSDVLANGYDVVFLNVPEPSNASLNRFYTVEFLREVKRVLAPGGVVAATLPTAGANYLGIDAGNYTGSFYHTLRDVFPHVVVAPDPGTRWFFAGSHARSVTSVPAVLAKRYEARQVNDDLFHPILFEGDFPAQRVKALADNLKRRADVPRNTDQRPVTYFYDTILWGRYSSSRITGAFRLFERVSFWVVIAVCGVAAVGFPVLRTVSRRWRRRGLAVAALWAVAAFGFAAMALEVVLLFAYQNLFGVIYQRIGAAVALFMAGLTGGALASRWFLIRLGKTGDTNKRFVSPAFPDIRRHAPERESEADLARAHEPERTAATARRVLYAALALALLLAALALALPSYLRTLSASEGVSERWMEVQILAVMVAAGVLTGAMFPLASRLHLAARELRTEGHSERPSQSQIGRTAGLVDAADHAGGCLGALATGVILVPILGIGQTSLIIAALALTTLVLLATNRPTA